MSGPIEYEVEVDGDAPKERLAKLVRAVDRIAEIPNSLRAGTAVRLVKARLNGSYEAEPSQATRRQLPSRRRRPTP